jgi:hypothetical protein
MVRLPAWIPHEPTKALTSSLGVTTVLVVVVGGTVVVAVEAAVVSVVAVDNGLVEQAAAARATAPMTINRLYRMSPSFCRLPHGVNVEQKT